MAVVICGYCENEIRGPLAKYDPKRGVYLHAGEALGETVDRLVESGWPRSLASGGSIRLPIGTTSEARAGLREAESVKDEKYQCDQKYKMEWLMKGEVTVLDRVQI